MKPDARCERCEAELLEDGTCPRCLLEVGLDSIDTTLGEDPRELSLDPGCIPGYELLERLGRGGMGVVYLARQLRLDRRVAVKVLSPNVRHLPQFAERFRREARAMASLSHPNVVAVHDFGEADGLYYLVMELVDGANLRELMRAGEIAPAQALEIVGQICAALHFAHERGVVHRDVKPENVLVDQEGRVRITDFGLARLLGARDEGRLTRSRHVMGTPLYMAPEQASAPTTVDHRADIYSLGVVLYELLTGELPMGRFRMPSERGPVDRRLDDVVLRALEREPERRFQKVSEMTDELAGLDRARGAAAPPPEPQEASRRPGPGADADPALPSFVRWFEVPLAALLFLGACLRWVHPDALHRVASPRDWGIVTAIAALAVPAVWVAMRQRPARLAMAGADLLAGATGFIACLVSSRAFTLPGGSLSAGFHVSVLASLALLAVGVWRLRLLRVAGGWLARHAPVPVEVAHRVRGMALLLAIVGAACPFLAFSAPAEVRGIIVRYDTVDFEPWAPPAIALGAGFAVLAVLLVLTRHARTHLADGLLSLATGLLAMGIVYDRVFNHGDRAAAGGAWLAFCVGVLLALGGAVLLADGLGRRFGRR